MRPEPTPEQAELKRAARELLEREVTVERLQRWETEALSDGEDLRSAIADLGWVGLGLPTDRGGSGAGLVEVACLLEECARGLLPRSLIGAIRSAHALALVQPESDVLGDLASGTKVLAVALDERRARSPEHYETRLRSSGAGLVVDGEKTYVPDAARADLHLVAAREGGTLRLALVDRRARGVAIEPLRTFGNDRQAHVRYVSTPVLDRLDPARGADRALAAVQRQQLAFALAEMIGGMGAVLDLTVTYVKEREQFGQKIAVFQAVRHQVADMGTAFTAARHMGWQAICRVAKDNLQAVELATAAAYVGQAFKRLCWAAHHLHGGAGFVLEHRLRFHSERAQSLCIRYTPEAPALEAVAAALLD